VTRYPFVTDSKVVTQAVVFQANTATLDEAEKIRINTFLTHFLQSGGGVLEIRLPAAANERQAEDRTQALQKHIFNKGARPYEIRLRKVAGAKSDNGPFILSFESFAARPIECPERNAPTAYNPTNRQHPDYGCSLRAGIAAMISNPADIRRPRDRQPSDAARRSRVIKNYRAGQPTESTQGENEASNSIRELGG
jgi:pilus assembly protein CpaD